LDKYGTAGIFGSRTGTPTESFNRVNSRPFECTRGVSILRGSKNPNTQSEPKRGKKIVWGQKYWTDTGDDGGAVGAGRSKAPKSPPILSSRKVKRSEGRGMGMGDNRQVLAQRSKSLEKNPPVN